MHQTLTGKKFATSKTNEGTNKNKYCVRYILHKLADGYGVLSILS
jgi:hypothetical protein